MLRDGEETKYENWIWVCTQAWRSPWPSCVKILTQSFLYWVGAQRRHWTRSFLYLAWIPSHRSGQETVYMFLCFSFRSCKLEGHIRFPELFKKPFSTSSFLVENKVQYTMCLLQNRFIFYGWFNFTSDFAFHILQTFGDYNLWLAAENGMFLRHTSGLWNTNMKQKFDMDWAVSVKVNYLKVSLVNSAWYI